MGKPRPLKKKHNRLERKILTVILSVAISSVGLMSIAMYGGMFFMRNDILNTVKTLSNDASQQMRSYLGDNVREQLRKESTHLADLATNRLNRLSDYVEQLGRYTEVIAASPEEYPNYELPFHDVHLLPGSVNSEFAGRYANCLTVFRGGDGTSASTFIKSDKGWTLWDGALPVNDAQMQTLISAWYDTFQANGQSAFWSDVFYLEIEGQQVAMISCLSPLYWPDDSFAGATGSIFRLDTILSDIVHVSGNYDSYDTLYLDFNGRRILQPDKNIFIDKKGNDQAEKVVQEILQRLTDFSSSVFSLEYQGKNLLMACSAVDNYSLLVCLTVEEEEILAPSHTLQSGFENLSQTTLSRYDQLLLTEVIVQLIVLLLVVLLTLLLGTTLARKITRPLKELSSGIEEMQKNNLNVRLNIQTGDELEEVAYAFNSTTARLQEYLATLTKIAAERRRNVAELSVARQIQTSMLPGEETSVKDLFHLDIWAGSWPAKEVGGDFYNYGFLDGDHFFLILGDASGMGVPAAMFMTIAFTVIRDHMTPEKSPADVFNEVNVRLCDNNLAGMFVTAFMGILELSTGRLVYANAGHTPPLVYRSGEDYQWLQMQGTLFLAGMDDTVYHDEEIILEPGDILFLYTDGVTEAKNLHKEFFGRERLGQRLNLNAVEAFSAKQIILDIKQDLDRFSKGADQADDITMLALKYMNEGEDANAT